MNCETVQRRLFEGAPDEQAVRKHLASCVSCGKTARRVESLDRLLAKTAPPVPPEAYWENQRRRITRPPKRRRPWILITPAAAVLVAVAVWIALPAGEKAETEPAATEGGQDAPVTRPDVVPPDPGEARRAPFQTPVTRPDVVLPDRPEYEDKITSENLLIGLAESGRERAILLMEAATHRMEEIAAAAETGRSDLLPPLVEAYRILVEEGVLEHLDDTETLDRIRESAGEHVSLLSEAMERTGTEERELLIGARATALRLAR